MGKSMRLICPECAAQYEVDESVIPEAGRDVQCSNCGHTWWQMRDGLAPDEPEAPAAATAAPAEPEPEPEEEWTEPEAAETEAAPAMATAAAAAPREDEDAGLAAALAAAPEAPKRSLDDAVLDVLRQEAERETKVREQETRAAAEAVAESAPAEEEAATDEAPAVQGTTDDGIPIAARPRSSRLPDIDEINSTLDGRDVPEEEEGTVHAVADGYRRRRGFRVGFVMMTALCGGLAVMYAYADRIAAHVPSLAPSLAVYTERVDAGRVWLDGAAIRATQTIQGLTSSE